MRVKRPEDTQRTATSSTMTGAPLTQGAPTVSAATGDEDARAHARADALEALENDPSLEEHNLPSAVRDEELGRQFLARVGPERLRRQLHALVREPGTWRDATPQQVALDVSFLSDHSPHPEALRDHPAVWSARLLRTGSSRLEDQVPQPLVEDRAFLLGVIEKRPGLYFRTSDALRADVDIARRAGRSAPWLIERMPLPPAVRRALFEDAAAHMDHWPNGASLDHVVRYASGIGGVSERIHRENPHVALAALAAGATPGGSVGPVLQKDLAFLVRVALEAPRALEAVLACHAGDERADAVVRNTLHGHPELYEHLPEAWRDDEALLAELLPRAPHLLQHASARLRARPAHQALVAAHDVRALPETIHDAVLAPARAHTVLQVTAGKIAVSEIPPALRTVQVARAALDMDVAASFSLWRDTDDAAVLGLLREALLRDPARVVREIVDVPARLDLSELPAAVVDALVRERPAALAAFVARLPADVRARADLRCAVGASCDPLPDGFSLEDPHVRQGRVLAQPESLLALPADECTDELVGAALALQPTLLARLPSPHRDALPLWRDALHLDGAALEHAPDAVRRNRASIQCAVATTPDAVRHALLPADDHRALWLECVKRGAMPPLPLDAAMARALVVAWNNDDRMVSPSSLTPLPATLVNDDALVDALLAADPSFLHILPHAAQTQARVRRCCAAGLVMSAEHLVACMRDAPIEHWRAAATNLPGNARHMSSTRPLHERREVALLALSNDASVLRWLPEVVRQDATFLAQAVAGNPLCVRGLSFNERILLDALHPEVMAAARTFEARLARLGIVKLARFEADFPTLRTLVEERERTDGKADRRPVAVCVYAADDPKNAFAHNPLAALTRLHRVLYYEVSSIHDVASAFRDASRRARPASFVEIAAHGEQRLMRLSKKKDQAPVVLRDTDAVRLRRLMRSVQVRALAHALLSSCSTGKRAHRVPNIVGMWAQVFPQCFVHAPMAPALIAPRFARDGTFLEPRYLDQGVRVPSLSLPPSDRHATLA